MTFANALENVIKISRQWDSTVFNNVTHGFLYHSLCLLASPPTGHSHQLWVGSLASTAKLGTIIYTAN